MNYTVQAADTVVFDDFIAAFNRAYKDYFTPIVLSRASLGSLIRRDAIDLSASVAATQDGTIVGVAMLAIRPPVGWIGGVGVVPEHRQQGIAAQMMGYLIDQAQQRRLQAVYLEVIVQNEIAHHLYKQLGFETLRRLLILDRPPTETQAMPGYHVSSCDALDALANYDEFHDVPNCWQRRREALEDMAFNLAGWTISAEDNPTRILGYCVGWHGNGRVNLMDVATSPNNPLRQTVAEALLAGVHSPLAESTGHIVNVGEDDSTLEPLQTLGYRETLAQYEMRLTL